jgi:hypothetical protein
MKAFAIIVILIALYLLYRIAYPKPTNNKQRDDNPVKREIDSDDVVGKSLYVRPSGQPRTTPATPLKTENQAEKPITFAPEIESKPVAIPSEELDAVFKKTSEEETFDESDLDIEEDDDDNEEVDLEEEAEDFRQMIGEDARIAGGFTYDEIAEAIKTPNRPEILYSLSKTDMFEQLVSGDAGRAAKISSVLDRYEQSLKEKETVASKKIETDYKHFDILNYV